MDTKNKIVKTAKVCGIISKVLYILSFAVCLTFIALAIALPLTDAVSSMTNGETATFFATLALYAFIFIGLLWNVEGIFNAIVQEQSPFSERVSHYLKKIAIFVTIVSVVPALVGTTIVRIVYPNTEITFPIEFGGVIAGAVLFFIGLFFNYGKELQKKDDETL